MEASHDPPDKIGRARRLLRDALLVFVVASLVYAAAREIAGRREARTAADAAVGDVESAKLVVYYFSQGKECVTCDQIEAFAREALGRYFADELASGVLAWRSIDVDEPRNEHYIATYELYTKSVVLVRMEDGKPGRWKNLDKVWDLIYNKAAYLDYVRAEIEAMLAEAP